MRAVGKASQRGATEDRRFWVKAAENGSQAGEATGEEKGPATTRLDLGSREEATRLVYTDAGSPQATLRSGDLCSRP